MLVVRLVESTTSHLRKPGVSKTSTKPYFGEPGQILIGKADGNMMVLGGWESSGGRSRDVLKRGGGKGVGGYATRQLLPPLQPPMVFPERRSHLRGHSGLTHRPSLAGESGLWKEQGGPHGSRIYWSGWVFWGYTWLGFRI